MRALLNGEIDLSLGIESPFKYHGDIEYRVLYQYKICVVCSFDHPLAAKSWVCPRNIMNQDMVLLSPNFGREFYRGFMEACRLDGFKPRVKKMVDTLDELIFEVSIGAGIAIVSRDVVRDTEVKVLDLKNSHHVSRYVLAYLKGHLDQFVRQFVKEVEENF